MITTKHKTISLLKDNKASISVDFLFSFLIVMGLTYLILALSFTLSFIEITQYITFSTARSYYASHKSKKEQLQQAEKKYTELIKNPAWTHFFNKTAWFEVDPSHGIIKDRHHDYVSQARGQAEMFTGASTSFISKLLAFNLPLFGSTQSDEEEGESFKTQVSSFLGRAPTINECLKFQERRNEILKKDCQGCGVIHVIADNGC